MERRLEQLNAFYAAYMAYFGAESDVVTADNIDAKDRATMAGICAVLASAGEAGTATTVEQGVVHEHAIGAAETPGTHRPNAIRQGEEEI